MSLTPFYNQTVQLASGHKVKLLGINHGDIFPLGRKTRKDLRDSLKDHKGPIFSEGVSKKFLPKEFVSKAFELEYPPIFKHVFQGVIGKLSMSKFGEILLKSALMDAKRFFKETVPFVNRSKLNSEEKEMRKQLKQDITKSFGEKEARDFFPLVTVRSFLQAKRILEHVKATIPHDFAVVAGMGHAVQIKKFLENPTLMNRYEKHITKAFEKIREYELLGLLDAFYDIKQ